MDLLESYERVQRAQARRDVDVLFAAVDALYSRIAFFFADPKKRRKSMILTAADFFPDLYGKGNEEEERKKAELEAFKSRRMARAEAWNKRFAERNKDTNGQLTGDTESNN